MGWRNLGGAYRYSFVHSIKNAMKRRYEKGGELHGNVFLGNPTDHLEEELLDAVFYAGVIKRRETEIVQLLGEVLTADGGQITPMLGYKICEMIRDLTGSNQPLNEILAEVQEEYRTKIDTPPNGGWHWHHTSDDKPYQHFHMDNWQKDHEH